MLGLVGLTLGAKPLVIVWLKIGVAGLKIGLAGLKIGIAGLKSGAMFLGIVGCKRKSLNPPRKLGSTKTLRLKPDLIPPKLEWTPIMGIMGIIPKLGRAPIMEPPRMCWA
jgi:hypothetical protein